MTVPTPPAVSDALREAVADKICQAIATNLDVRVPGRLRNFIRQAIASEITRLTGDLGHARYDRDGWMESALNAKARAETAEAENGRLLKDRAHAEAVSHGWEDRFNAMYARAEAAEAETARLRAERLILDKRIHNQRVALRQNWEIVEMRNSNRQCADVRSRLLAACCRVRAEARAEGRRQGLEEAKTACLDLSDTYRETGEHHMGVGPQGPDLILTKAAEALAWARGATECAYAVGKLLATSSTETQKPETGESIQ